MGDGTNKKFIVVAEDNKLIAKVLSNKLAAAGYEVVVAYNGDEALQAVATRLPDLLLMDLIMPIKDGFITLQELRANPTTKDLKVVITSDLKQTEDIDRVQKLGVLGFFDKANTQAIVDKVPEFIGLNQA